VLVVDDVQDVADRAAGDPGDQAEVGVGALGRVTSSADGYGLVGVDEDVAAGDAAY
jgi:hypothetical protein